MNSHQDERNPAQSSSQSDVAQKDWPDEERRELADSEPIEKNQPNPAEGLLGLREQLQDMRQRFDVTDAQIAGYLREHADGHREPAGNGAALVQVQQSLDLLLSKFEEAAPRFPAPMHADPTPGSEPATSGGHEVLDAIKKLSDIQHQLAGKIVNTVAKRITEELDLLRFQQIVHETITTEWDRRDAEAEAKARQQAEAKALAFAESEPDYESEIVLQDIELEDVASGEDPSSDAWSRAIWGPELIESEGFVPFLDELNQRLLAGDAGIATLAGQLLVFRQSPPEAKPQQLKDVGEAYYRTRLDAAQPDHPFEGALISWLQHECERAGLPNTIEVVHVGERFDKSRHSSTTRGGAEVAEVFGWVVLTEGGRVYTRASVAAQ